MATTAAILETIVRANTAPATRELRQYDSYLHRVDKSSVSTTARTNTLGKATGALGSRMRSAAGYAAGAAAAYISISQAKAAVTTTQDLAKTTAGLNRNLGLTVKEGSRWAAVAKSRDIDAKALTMSFTTLSRRVVDTSAALKEGGSAAQTAMAPFKRLGISQQEVVRGSKDLDAFLPRLADAFGNAAGGAERQASAQQLLGRGYATILPLFAQGAEGLKEQQMWADKYGTTLNEKTLKAQMDLVQAQRESKVAWIGIQVAFAQFVTPALKKVNEEFQKISKIMADDKLTGAEKWERIGNIIGKWADKALDAFVRVLPQIVERAAEAAPKIAAAIFEGFKNADMGGKLGLLLFGGAALGGGLIPAATRAGIALAPVIATPIGAAVTASIVAGIAGAHVGSKLDIGQTDFANAIAEEFDLTIEKARKVDAFMAAHPGLGVPETLEIMQNRAEFARLGWDDFWDRVSNRTRRGGLDLNATTEKAFGNFKELMRGAAGSANKNADDAWQYWKGFGVNLNSAQGKGKVQNYTNTLKDLFGDIPQSSKKDSDDAWQYWKGFGLHLNSDQGKGQVQSFKTTVTGSFQSLAKVSIGAMAKLSTETKSTLASLGSKDSNVYIASYSGGGGSSNTSEAKAQTGWLVPGQGTGDRVPALLEPGEVVVNKRAAAAMGGAARVNELNRAIPRFAKGGTINFASGLIQALGPYNVPPVQYDPNHAGGNSHLHLSGDSVTWAKSLAAAIAPLGWSASESPWAGGVTVAHQDPGHYSGSAFDANAGDESRSAVAKVAEILGGSGAVAGGGAVAVKKLKQIMLEGPAGAMLDIGQAAVDKVRGVANKFIAANAPVDDGNQGSVSISGIDTGPIQDMAKQMVMQIWGAGQWAPFVSLEMAEAGWDPYATNPDSGAYGLAQALPPSKYPPLARPGANVSRTEHARAQLEWMMSYIQDRYGDPASAWAFHQGHNWYQQGGVVQKMQEGGKILLVGDSITKMALDAGGFPGGWDHPGTVVGGKPAHTWGDKQVQAHWGDSDYAALAFMMGTNDATASGNLKPALNTVKGAIGKAGLALMTVPSGSTDQGAKNRLINSFGAQAIADIAGVPLSDGLHPTSPEGINTFRARIKEAGNAAKKAFKGGNGGGSGGNGGNGGEEAGYPSDLSAAGMSFGEWVQSVLGDGSKGTQGLSDRIRKAIKQTTDNITLWDAVIAGQEIRDSMSYSEEGSELGPLERANQIVMNENLLMTLKAMKAWVLEGLKTPRLKATARARLEGLLEGVQGVRGSKTGRILDVESTLDQLRNPDTSGSGEAENNAARIELLEGLLRDANLRTAVSQAQYDVFKNFAGGFAAGGFIGAGQWGVVGESGPEVVGGPMAVSPMGGTTVIINGDIVNTPPGKQAVEVQGAKAIVQQGSRGMGRRPLGSARGY